MKIPLEHWSQTLSWRSPTFGLLSCQLLEIQMLGAALVLSGSQCDPTQMLCQVMAYIQTWTPSCCSIESVKWERNRNLLIQVATYHPKLFAIRAPHMVACTPPSAQRSALEKNGLTFGLSNISSYAWMISSSPWLSFWWRLTQPSHRSPTQSWNA